VGQCGTVRMQKMCCASLGPVVKQHTSHFYYSHVDPPCHDDALSELIGLGAHSYSPSHETLGAKFAALSDKVGNDLPPFAVCNQLTRFV
jgi:hypothetical protein